MALAKKIKENLSSIVVGGLIVTNLVTIGLWFQEKEIHADTIDESKVTIESLTKDIETLSTDNKQLSSILDHKVNSSSIIGSVRDSLVDKIQTAVKDRGEDLNNPALSISDIDAKRALKSAENRVMDEYIRLASLVLATMNVETNFKHIVNENPNGTKDYGIMQVNDAIIPEVKDALGEDIDPVANKTDNVESGSWEIYDCYLLAKEKHPENVIWWTYAYYNRGKYFESKDNWRNPNNPQYASVHKQAEERSNKFKNAYEYYYNTLKETVDNI